MKEFRGQHLKNLFFEKFAKLFEAHKKANAHRFIVYDFFITKGGIKPWMKEEKRVFFVFDSNICWNNY